MSRFLSIVFISFSALSSFIMVNEAKAGAFTSESPNQGFLTKIRRPITSADNTESNQLAERLCAELKQNSRKTCPPNLKGASSSIVPTNDFTNLKGTSSGIVPTNNFKTYQPNLRLNIVLIEWQNIKVSGSGVESLEGGYGEPFATFKIQSSSADYSVPEPFDEAYWLPAPEPGDTISDFGPPLLFQGIIENGCLGTPATFDLSLESSIFRYGTGETLGEVSLQDSVEGHGYYKFKYTIRATDEDGNVSDFVFRGNADSYCTSNLTL